MGDEIFHWTTMGLMVSVSDNVLAFSFLFPCYRPWAHGWLWIYPRIISPWVGKWLQGYLPEINIAPENGCFEDDSVPFGAKGLSSGANCYVSCRFGVWFRFPVTDGRMAPFSWSSMTFAMRCDTEPQRHVLPVENHATCFPKHRIWMGTQALSPLFNGHIRYHVLIVIW